MFIEVNFRKSPTGVIIIRLRIDFRDKTNVSMKNCKQNGPSRRTNDNCKTLFHKMFSLPIPA